MKKYWILLIVVMVLMPLAQGLSLSGQKLSPIIYRPGLTITNHYIISGSDAPIEVVVDRGPFRDITVTPVVNNEFDLVIMFGADEYVPPGSHSFGLTAREVAVVSEEEEGSGVGSLTSVSKVFNIEVYSYEKDIRIGLEAANVNVGGNVTFQLSVASVGYPDIEQVQGEITVFDENTELGRILTPAKPLKSLKGRTFKVPFDASALSAGEYGAKAVVTYDGKQKSANTTFLIGNMDVLVDEYTKELLPGFSEFAVKVTNNWGNSLRNVYAKLFIEDQELLQTPSINLDAWQKGELKGIMKVDLEPGGYQGKLLLFFEAASKEVPIFITVKASIPENAAEAPQVQEPQSLDLSLWVFFSVIIVGILVAFLLYKRQEGGKVDF